MFLLRKDSNLAMQLKHYKEIDYLTFPLLEKTGLVNHLFSTRNGGVSEGIFSSMNLSYSRGDNKAAVDENFRRIAELMDSKVDKMVFSQQTHTTNIRTVSEADCGKGVIRELDYQDVDGMITNIPGIILCTFFADCVPLYFVDIKNRVIGLAHSGWRGTVNKMGEKMLVAMQKAYGTEPCNVIAAIGPSICKECYEVSEDVASAFINSLPQAVPNILSRSAAEGKYQLDLWEANRSILTEAGVPDENIQVTDICTCCNSSVLFSHRASEGKRGNLGAFMELRKS